MKRLYGLADRHGLGPESVSRFTTLLSALEAPNAPTTVRDPMEAVDVHVADALSALELPDVRAAGLLADLGAGAGVPGLVLAAALASTRVALVESVAKKCAFIAETAAAMQLDNVEVVCSRAEEWTEGHERCDVVTARALATLPVLCEYAAPLLRPGGLLVAWKGDVSQEEARDGRAAAQVLGLSEPQVVPVEPYPESRSRRLYLFRKTAPTPAGFPRRPGMATKRPLSASSRT